MIEVAVLPSAQVMTVCAVSREAGGTVIRIGRTIVVVLVARIALG